MKVMDQLDMIYGDGKAPKKKKKQFTKPLEHKKKEVIPTEHQEQCAVVQFCRWSNYPLIAIPNANVMSFLDKKTAQRVMMKLKAEGLAPGAPDLFLPMPRSGFHGLFIEMKRLKGSKVSAEQKEWIQTLNDAGYLAKICYGADDAIITIKEYDLGRATPLCATSK